MGTKYTLVKNLEIYTLYASDGSKVGNSYESPHHRLSIKNCKSIEMGYDLEDLFYSKVGVPLNDRANIRYEGFILGAETILELIGNKNKELYEFTRDCASNWDCDKDSHRYDTPCRMCEAKKLLQKNEWEVEIEMEIYHNTNKENTESYTEFRPKLDSEGCIILKSK